MRARSAASQRWCGFGNGISLAKELVAASTEPLILTLLAQGESYGYALIQAARRKTVIAE